jgi:hypothetical protein
MATVPGAVSASNALTCPDDIFGNRRAVDFDISKYGGYARQAYPLTRM